jgi:hypothetical protein
MTDIDHTQFFLGFSDVLSTQDWDRLGDYVHDDATIDYPQSGERFRGLVNIRAQFANYPDLGPGTSELQEVIGGTAYALTPTYTVIGINGSGDRGTAIIRVRYPDGTWWWVLNLYELRDGRLARSRAFFAPDFEPPDWRAPFREAI